tara:strand:+ start:150 stop:608 length:459 start_codon:yes stop_codon:yes gene_type:complete
MIVPYARFYENKSRKYVDGKRYRLGNPSHPCYDYYKQHGMDKTLNHMKITGGNYTNHSNSRVGDLSEYYAITWLWDQGYEVFPNAGSQGMVDMIAWHPTTEETIFIDVKTSDNNRNDPTRTRRQASKKIKVLLYNKDTRKLRFVEHKNEQSD